jgi:glycine cleavage system H protein
MSIPDELRYTAEHEWVAVSGSVASVGITDYAQQALGDVVYVSVPAPGTRVTAGEPCGEVESTKSVSDIYSPVDGEVSEVNPDLEDDPALVNSDPYGAGWLMKIQVDDPDNASGLLSADEYADHTQGRGADLDRGLGHLFHDPCHGALGDVGRADPLGERVDGPCQVRPGALDLFDQSVRVPQRDLTVRFRHCTHPFSHGVRVPSLPGRPPIGTADRP